MENKTTNKKKGNFVYSIKINENQNRLLKKNKWIKEELNKLVLDFFKIYNV